MTGSTPPLRILQANSLFNGGGTDNQTLVLSAGLRDLGEAVTLMIPHGSRWEPLARNMGLRVGTFPAQSWLKQAMIRRLVHQLRQDRIQILHAHQGRDFWPAILAARLAACGTKVVISRHLMTRPRALTRALLLRLSEVIAVSHAVEAVLQRELRGPRARLHQIYGGIDLRAFRAERTPAARAFRQQQGWSDAAVVFGVVGAFHYPRGKGQLEFLEAAARLRAEFPAAGFAIVGKGEMESRLVERIAALGLTGSAAVVPFTDDIATTMNALDVLVHPALGTEALGLVLWEAMACAKPVIASRLDGIPEAFVEHEQGLLVPPRDVAALAKAMRGLAASADLRARLGRAGRAHVERNFSSVQCAQRTRELYRAVLARR